MEEEGNLSYSSCASFQRCFLSVIFLNIFLLKKEFLKFKGHMVAEGEVVGEPRREKEEVVRRWGRRGRGKVGEEGERKREG